MMIIRVLVMFLLISGIGAATAPAQKWERQNVATKASLRGLAVVSRDVIWASGTGGTVLRTVDGGKNWDVISVPEAAQLDFRDIEAFDGQTAFVLSIGNGRDSRIYKTSDGGKTWNKQFENDDERVFLDAFIFWNRQHGLAMSDPSDGRFVLFETTNGGQNWKRLSNSDKAQNAAGKFAFPPATDGEAAFAASGTCLLRSGKNGAFLVSGGSAARVFFSSDRGRTWTVNDAPIRHGTPAQGIFSIAMADSRFGVIVGGDYSKPNERASVGAFTSDGGKSWQTATGLGGYRSGVAFIEKKTFIAVGTNGSDLSTNSGRTWTALDNGNYNAVAARGRAAVWAVGPQGLVSRLIFTR